MPDDFPKGETHVYLQAISSGFHTHERIPVTTVNGFIFIQTDKPLYTPDQEGQYDKIPLYLSVCGCLKHFSSCPGRKGLKFCNNIDCRLDKSEFRMRHCYDPF